MTYIINQSAIVLFFDNQSVRIEKTDKRYPKIIEAFNLPKEDQDNAIRNAVFPEQVSINSIDGKCGFSLIDGDIFYKNEKLPIALAEKIKSIIREDLPLEQFENFWNNIKQNPSSTSVSELMEFLEYKELPITEDGCFLAYKGVNSDYYSVHGNLETVVIKGTVDERGRILNTIGEEIEVSRRFVDDNRKHHCSFGLHVGSLNYATSFGVKTVVVKVNPKDVVSVPSDYDCQKCRVSAYKVISEYEREIISPITTEDGEETVPDYVAKRDEFVDRIAAYLDKKSNQGYDEVTVRQIQNSFSPAYPSREQILDAVQVLNLDWWEEDGVYYVAI